MNSVTILVALTAAAVMGFANQRGGTCAVAAIREVVEKRRFKHVLSLLEAALWAGGGLVILGWLGLLRATPAGYAASGLTLLGGALFGLGAFVNRACIFGTVARLGSGEWAYLATAPGFFLGALATRGLPVPVRLGQAPILWGAIGWAAALLALVLAARLASHGRRLRQVRAPRLRHVWSPHIATTVIGVAFVVSVAAAGAWSYTDVLADLANGQRAGLPFKAVLNLVMVAGAILGGWTAGRLRGIGPDLVMILRCLAGGTIMGAASALIPGGNTTLILLGMPMLWAYAWLAVGSMLVTIYVAVRLTRPKVS